MHILNACIRIGICRNDFLFQASYYRKPARAPFFGIGQAVELGEDRYLAQLLYRDRKNVKNVVPLGDRDTKENLEMTVMLQVYSFFSIKDMDSKWKHWKVRNMPKAESYTYFRNFESKATVREQLDGVVFDPAYSGRMIHRSRYDFREMRKLRKGPSWKAPFTMENFEDKKEDGSGKR